MPSSLQMNGVGEALPTVHCPLLVVGGGPVGFFVALKVAQTGVSVTLIESEKGILDLPKAIGYMPMVLTEMEKLGVKKDLVAQGLVTQHGHRWKTIKHETLCEISAADLAGQEGANIDVIFLGQQHVTEILRSHLAALPNAKILFSHRLVGLKQDRELVTALVSTLNGEMVLTADYVVGCDGGSSFVRKSQCIPFDGFTFDDFRFVATNIEYDFEKEAGWKTGSYIVDPEHWAAIVRTGVGNEWRVNYGEPTSMDFSPEAVRSRFDENMKILLPGTKQGYKLKGIWPFIVHQRCARKFREGRILLAGDAAHLNNPIGGLGLTTGLLDATASGNVLNRIFKGESDSLLEDYAQSRRNVFLTFSNPTSIANKSRLTAFDEESVRQRARFFDQVNNNKEFLKTMRSGLSNLMPESFESES